jgi:rieske iron-sulfur protein
MNSSAPSEMPLTPALTRRERENRQGREVDGNDLGCASFSRCYERRTVLMAALGLGLGWSMLNGAMAQDSELRNMRPQAGDRLVFATGERKGDIIAPADVPLGRPPVLAYPMDLPTKTVRDGSRLNQVLLIRLDAEALAAETRIRSAAGILAYSAVCTHAGCDVADWQADMQTLMCFCHYSQFDPKDGARVVDGPAPRRLAALPLQVADGVLMAAGGFVGRVGFQPG